MLCTRRCWQQLLPCYVLQVLPRSRCFKSSSTTRYFQKVSSKVPVVRCTILERVVGHFKDPKALFRRHHLLITSPSPLARMFAHKYFCQIISGSLTKSLARLNNTPSFVPQFPVRLYRFAGAVLSIETSAHHMPKTGFFSFSVKLMHIRYHSISFDIIRHHSTVQEIVLFLCQYSD